MVHENGNSRSQKANSDSGEPEFLRERKFIGDRVRLARQEMGLTQGQLADEAGISLRYVNHLESATKGVSVEILQRIARVLQRDMNWFTQMEPNGSLVALLQHGLQWAEKLERENEDLRRQLAERSANVVPLRHPPGSDFSDRQKAEEIRRRAAEARSNPVRRAAREPKKPKE